MVGSILLLTNGHHYYIIEERKMERSVANESQAFFHTFTAEYT
jgi:hypothetical protein